MISLCQQIDAFFADAATNRAEGEDDIVRLYALSERLHSIIGYHMTLASFAYYAAALGDIAEIGTCYGLGAISLDYGAALRDATRKTISIELYSYNCQRAAARAARLGLQRIQFVTGTSAKLADYGKIFGLIYVDADHDYEPCLADLRNASACVVDGGKILCHDYHTWYDKNEVVPAVGQFLEENLDWDGMFVGDGFLLLGRGDADPRIVGWTR